MESGSPTATQPPTPRPSQSALVNPLQAITPRLRSVALPAATIPSALPPAPRPSPVRLAARPSVWALVPGSLFAGGRYRLLERCGGSADTAFWRAHDSELARDVAVTVIDLRGGESATALFASTMWLCRSRSEAIAFVYDMVDCDGRAVVVAQWKQSHALGMLRAGRPADAATALGPLARMVADAHRDAAVAGLDHPSRIRVDADGVAFLAFPAVPDGATASGDVRGLGNALSELLTGMHHAGNGRPVPPSALRPDVPEAISALVVDAINTNAAAGHAAPALVTADQFATRLDIVATGTARSAAVPASTPADALPPADAGHWRPWLRLVPAHRC